MTYTVDIKTRFIPDNQRVYIVFPGEAYKFYTEMRDKSSIFLDIPGFPLPEQKENTNLDDSDFVQRLTMSERISLWHANGKPQDNIPIRDLNRIDGYRRTQRKIQLAGLVRNFYYELRKGDIVVVPCRDYEDDVLFGEIVDDFVTSSIEVRQYPGEKIPVRKVKWLKRVQRGNVPSWLQRKFPIPSPVHQIEQSFFKDIFDIMYQRYYFKEDFVCKYAVTSAEFSSLDDYFFQEIMLYVTALYAKSHDHDLSNLSGKSISSLVRELQRSEALPDLRININSPGHIVSYAKKLTPIIAGVLIALSASDALCDDAQINDPPIVITNSADDSQIANECVADVQREVLEDLKAMGYEHWQEICKSEKLIREHTGLNSGMTVKKDSN